MRLSIVLVAMAGCWCSVGANHAAALPEMKLTSSVSLATDYVYNGISQTGATGAWQLDLNLAGPLGLYADAWASRTRFSETPGVIAETDLSAGWDHTFGDWTVDTAANFVIFPTSGGSMAVDNTELLVSVTHPVLGTTIGASFGFSPDFSNHSGRWWSGALDASLPLVSGIKATGRLGYQSTERPGMYGLPAYFDALVGLRYQILNFAFDLAETWTSVPSNACDDRCAPRLTAAVTISY